MYTKAEKEKQTMLYVITSLSFVFSGILTSVIHNIFYQSDIVPWGFLSSEEEILNYLYTSFFDAFTSIISFVPFVISILIYNSMCSEPKFSRCKIDPLCCLYGSGISYIGSLLSEIIVTAVLGILLACGYSGTEIPRPVNRLYVAPFFYIPSCIACIVLNIIFWRLYFKHNEKNLQKDSEVENMDKNHATAKNASVCALLITTLTFIAFICSLFFPELFSDLITSLNTKRDSSTIYEEYFFYNSIKEIIIYSIPKLAGIFLSIFIYNLISKKCKASYLGFSYVVASMRLSTIVSYLLLGIVEVFYFLIYLNAPDFYESIRETNSIIKHTLINSITYYISFWATSMLVWTSYFKQKLNVPKDAKIVSAQYNTAPQYVVTASTSNSADLANQNQQVVQITQPSEQRSDKSRGIAAVLCFFFGTLGIHRFYVGKIGTGLLWLFTLGFFGIGDIIDFLMIICGSFKDSEGRKI